MAKSLLLTYLLWLIGGFFGVHHIYLRRYKQAFVWWCFPGKLRMKLDLIEIDRIFISMSD